MREFNYYTDLSALFYIGHKNAWIYNEDKTQVQIKCIRPTPCYTSQNYETVCLQIDAVKYKKQLNRILKILENEHYVEIGVGYVMGEKHKIGFVNRINDDHIYRFRPGKYDYKRFNTLEARYRSLKKQTEWINDTLKKEDQ